MNYYTNCGTFIPWVITCYWKGISYWYSNTCKNGNGTSESCRAKEIPVSNNYIVCDNNHVTSLEWQNYRDREQVRGFQALGRGGEGARN